MLMAACWFFGGEDLRSRYSRIQHVDVVIRYLTQDADLDPEAVERELVVTGSDLMLLLDKRTREGVVHPSLPVPSPACTRVEASVLGTTLMHVTCVIMSNSHDTFWSRVTEVEGLGNFLQFSQLGSEIQREAGFESMPF
ncbi:hypothetical protein MG293_005504 [Ovis ammon polii]|uniref:Uncharacterized protein n=1 Tax=Ovis ammon polii TaxID=230172 RepID=A0AAD4UDK7_OVIAM|nr:hypothetical protein MG293_005504 [Ovis ammon polii]